MPKAGQQFAVFIATTQGPVRVQHIDYEDDGVLSHIGVEGSTRPEPITRDYRHFVDRSSGLVARRIGHDAFRISLSDGIEQGHSWQAGMMMAHILKDRNQLAEGDSLDDVDHILWLTGEVRAGEKLAPVQEVGRKFDRSADLFAAAAATGLAVSCFCPQGNAQDIPANLPDHVTAQDNVDIPAIENAVFVAAASSKKTTAATGSTADTTSTTGNHTLPVFLAFVGAVAAFAALVFWKPEILGMDPNGPTTVITVPPVTKPDKPVETVTNKPVTTAPVIPIPAPPISSTPAPAALPDDPVTAPATPVSNTPVTPTAPPATTLPEKPAGIVDNIVPAPKPSLPDPQKEETILVEQLPPPKDSDRPKPAPEPVPKPEPVANTPAPTTWPDKVKTDEPPNPQPADITPVKAAPLFTGNAWYAHVGNNCQNKNLHRIPVLMRDANRFRRASLERLCGISFVFDQPAPGSALTVIAVTGKRLKVIAKMTGNKITIAPPRKAARPRLYNLIILASPRPLMEEGRTRLRQFLTRAKFADKRPDWISLAQTMARDGHHLSVVSQRLLPATKDF